MTTTLVVIYVVTCAVAAISASVVCITVWHRREVQGAGPLALVMVLVAQWCIAAALESITADYGLKLLWAKAEYIGITTTPLALLIFVSRYTGRDGWLRGRHLLLLTIIPVLTVLLDWTDEWHGLIHSQRELLAGGAFTTWRVSYGPAFWVNTVYQYVLLAAAFGLGFIGLVGRGPALRGQALWLVLGLTAPWVANLVYVSGFKPAPRLDFTPPAFAITGLAVTATLVHARLLDLVPIAHRAVLDSMSAAVVVVDRQERIQALNPAAARFVRTGLRTAKGKLAADVLVSPVASGLGAAPGPPSTRDVRIAVDRDERVFEIHNTPIQRRHGPSLGRLMLISDVTERVEAAEERVRFAAERAARREAEAGRRKAALLADISTRLAHPLDLQSMLARLSASIVPAFAGGMVLELLASSGLGEHCAAAYATDQGRELLKMAVPLYVHGSLTRTASRLSQEVGDNTLGPALLQTANPESLEALGFQSAHVEACQALNVSSVIRVPLRIRQQLIGMVYLAGVDGHAFEPADLVFAEDLAERCALTLDNIRLYQTTRQEVVERERAESLLARRAFQRRALVEFEHTALTGVDIPRLLPEAVRLITDVFPSVRVAIVERASSGGALRVVATGGWRREDLEATTDSPEAFLASKQPRTAPVVVDDWQTDPADCPLLLTTHQVRTTAVFPILQPGQQGAAAWLAAHDPEPRHFSRADLGTLESVAHILGVAMERKHAEEAIHRFARRCATIQEEERRHVARELHDEIGQQLTGLHLLLGMIASSTPTAQPRLDDARVLVSDLLQRVRDLSLELRPTVLDDLGLEPSLKWLAARYTRMTGVAVRLIVSESFGRLPTSIETAAYRIAQEALTNVARHSGATSATVRLSRDPCRLVVEVIDSGCGFDVASTSHRGETTGLAGMRERAEAAGGAFTLISAPGVGTHLRVEFAVVAALNEPPRSLTEPMR